MTSSPQQSNLPERLRSAAVDVIAERGLSQFSMREVARRAGVSHTAPAHHFGSLDGLLGAVASEGFEILAQTTTAALQATTDPVQRLAAVGRAYVELAKNHPGHAAVMFRPDAEDTPDTLAAAQGAQAFQMLIDTLNELIDAEGLDVDLFDATALYWSSMQGLLVLEKRLALLATQSGSSAPPSTGELVIRLTDLVVNGLRGSSESDRRSATRRSG